MKEFLNQLVDTFNTPEFIQNDPVQFPHRYDKLQDQEIAGFIIALISWGKRNMILRNANELLAKMGNSPYQYILNRQYDSFEGGKSIHRTFNNVDFQYICNGLRSIYTHHDSMEELFCRHDDLFDGIELLRNEIIAGNAKEGNLETRSWKHLASPAKKSACKRIHMFLRWMVRQDGIVDLGVWKNISPSQLYIPLDTHVMQVSHKLNLLDRDKADRLSVSLLTNTLKEFDPFDPAKYDFALFGAGVSGVLFECDDIQMPQKLELTSGQL